jgi:acetoin utilization deacetylase AcuC-like enzyme
MKEPCFGLIRPPGHHASANSCWGFCFFNNMAIALEKLKRDGKINKALVLDIDLHFGDGTVNILGGRGYVTLVNPSSNSPADFLRQVEKALEAEPFDVIGISAGFDYAREDWGGVLSESDYTEIGKMVRTTARKTNAGFFAILEGGYNHRVLGHNCLALLEGIRED